MCRLIEKRQYYLLIRKCLEKSDVVQKRIRSEEVYNEEEN